jgi:hypothetical protein
VLMGDIEYGRAVYSLFIIPMTAALLLMFHIHTK